MIQSVELPKSRCRSQLAWPVAWVGTTVVGLLLRPNPAGHGTHTQLGLPSCPSVLIFGRPCPGCGMTTSWTNLLHGRLVESFQSNAVGPVMYAAFTFMAVVSLVLYFKGRYWDTNTRTFNLASSVLLAAFLIYGAVRFAQLRYPVPALAEMHRATN
jgi:hypothetical protein